MTALHDYLEPIELAGKHIGKQYRGHRMDGTSPSPDMRKDAGLGTCNSCDYFLSHPTAVVLVEETRLVWQIKNLKQYYHYLAEPDQTDFVTKSIRDEMKLKVYGSMLVLCRLSALRTDAKDVLEGKKYEFWLIASGEFEQDDVKVLDNIRDNLLGELKSVLTGQVLEDVEIMLPGDLETKLSQIPA